MPDNRARQRQSAEIERYKAGRRPQPGLPAVGRCQYCEAPVGPRQRFCNDVCEDRFWDDWQAGKIRYRDLCR